MYPESKSWFIVESEIKAIEEKDRTWKITYKLKDKPNTTNEIKTYAISFEGTTYKEYSARVILQAMDEPYVIELDDIIHIAKGDKEFACSNTTIFTQKAFITKKLHLLEQAVNLSNRELDPLNEEIKPILENKLKTCEPITGEDIARLNNALFSYRDVIDY